MGARYHSRTDHRLPGVMYAGAMPGAGLGEGGQGSVREGSCSVVAGDKYTHGLDGAGEWHWTCTQQRIPPVCHRPIKASR